MRELMLFLFTPDFAMAVSAWWCYTWEDRIP